MVCKVRVDARAGIIELEGEAAFVSGFFEKMLPLVEKAGFGAGVPASPAAPNPDTISEPAGHVPEPATPTPKIKRKKRANPPAGASCRDRILSLKQDGFFKEQRTVSDIVAGLGKKGWTHNSSQAGAALTIMFSKGEIQRTNEGSGFTYYWDRD